MRTISRWLQETAGGLPRQYWYLWCTTLINRVGSFVVVVLAIYLTSERGLSEAFAGLVIGLWGAGGAVGTTVGGVLADRWGRKPTLLAALWGAAALLVVLGLMRGPVAIAISALLLGAAAEAARPAISALMVDIVPASDRARAYSLHYWVINVGFAFAATAAGFVAGVEPMLLFLVDAATTAAAALWAAWVIREPVRPHTAAVPTGTGLSTGDNSLIAVLRDRVFLVFVGANLLIAFVFLQHTSTLPLSMTRDGLSPSAFGSVIALNGVLIVAGQFFVTWVLRRLDPTIALVIASITVGIGFGLTTFAATPLFYAITVLIWTVGEMFQAPSNATTVAALAPAHLRGRYQGVFGLSWAVASFLAPLLGGAVLQYGGKAALWLGCLGLALAAATIHLLARASRDRRVTQLAAAESAPTLVAAAHS
ncbi:MAG: MFS transporter [Micromonosporaceae bacterium]|nr:MFS transporter [Micromonosporaceae bacterium]